MKRNTPLDLFTGPLIVLGGRACCEMMRTMLVALALSGLVGGPAAAEVVNGSKLLADCRWERVSDISYALVPAGLYCLPAQVDSGQVLDIAKLYIQNHAPKLIVDALVEKFPCN